MFTKTPKSLQKPKSLLGPRAQKFYYYYCYCYYYYYWDYYCFYHYYYYNYYLGFQEEVLEKNTGPYLVQKHRNTKTTTTTHINEELQIFESTLLVHQYLKKHLEKTFWLTMIEFSKIFYSIFQYMFCLDSIIMNNFINSKMNWAGSSSCCNSSRIDLVVGLVARSLTSEWKFFYDLQFSSQKIDS